MNSKDFEASGERPLMKYNSSKVDFSKLEEVPVNSVVGRLFKLLDDIDTASDMFKPKIEGYEKYIFNKIEEAQKLIVSDGYKLYFLGEEG